jgi:hypothetical protein
VQNVQKSPWQKISFFILATSQSIESFKEVVKVLEVDKRNIRRVVEKR